MVTGSPSWPAGTLSTCVIIRPGKAAPGLLPKRAGRKCSVSNSAVCSATEKRVKSDGLAIRVDAFSQQVDASGEALREIFGAVRQVSDVVEKIAQASREQSLNVVQDFAGVL